LNTSPNIADITAICGFAFSDHHVMVKEPVSDIHFAIGITGIEGYG
jgi:hypothetical protein